MTDPDRDNLESTALHITCELARDLKNICVLACLLDDDDDDALDQPLPPDPAQMSLRDFFVDADQVRRFVRGIVNSSKLFDVLETCETCSTEERRAKWERDADHRARSRTTQRGELRAHLDASRRNLRCKVDNATSHAMITSLISLCPSCQGAGDAHLVITSSVSELKKLPPTFWWGLSTSSLDAITRRALLYKIDRLAEDIGRPSFLSHHLHPSDESHPASTPTWRKAVVAARSMGCVVPRRYTNRLGFLVLDARLRRATRRALHPGTTRLVSQENVA